MLRRRVAPRTASVFAGSVAPQRRRLSLFENPTVREENAFLARHCPIRTLGVPYTANTRMKDIHDAFARAKRDYGPAAKRPSPGDMDACERAYKIVCNPNSGWYARTELEDPLRMRLRMELLSTKERTQLTIQVVLWYGAVALASLMVLRAVLWPFYKMHHAITRT